MHNTSQNDREPPFNEDEVLIYSPLTNTTSKTSMREAYGEPSNVTGDLHDMLTASGWGVGSFDDVTRVIQEGNTPAKD